MPILIENTAGGDNAMARRFDALARLWDAVGEFGVGFCLDTCHALRRRRGPGRRRRPGQGDHRPDRPGAPQQLPRRVRLGPRPARQHRRRHDRPGRAGRGRAPRPGRRSWSRRRPRARPTTSRSCASGSGRDARAGRGRRPGPAGRSAVTHGPGVEPGRAPGTRRRGWPRRAGRRWCCSPGSRCCSATRTRPAASARSSTRPGRSAPDYDVRVDHDVCYSDIQQLWLGRDIDQHVFPYVHGVDHAGRASWSAASVEYPVLTGLLIWARRAVRPRPTAEFLLCSALLMAPFGLLTGWMLGRLARWRALLWALGPPLVLYAFHNWDLPVVACAVGAVYAVHGWRTAPPAAPTGPRWPRCCSGWASRSSSTRARSCCRWRCYVLTASRPRRGVGLARRAAGASRPPRGTAVLVNLPFAVAGLRGLAGVVHLPAAAQGRPDRGAIFATGGEGQRKGEDESSQASLHVTPTVRCRASRGRPTARRA